MQFKRGNNLEQMPEQLGGLSYSKNYVARSRMEQILAQEEEDQQQDMRAQNRPNYGGEGRMAGFDSAPLKKRNRRPFEGNTDREVERPKKDRANLEEE